MQSSYGETSEFKAVTAEELMLVNGGKGSVTQVSWGNPVNDYVAQKIVTTYYNINNFVGSAVLNAAPIVASTIISFGTTFINGMGGIFTTFISNTGGSSGSLY